MNAPRHAGPKGRLLLIPNTLDLGTLAEGAPPPDLQEVLPLGAVRAAAGLRHWVAENARSARALLKRVNAVVPLVVPLQEIEIRELPRPPKGGARAAAPAIDWVALLAPALQGHDLGLVSEAGLPAIADPGAALVRAAHAQGIAVLPLSGPSSLMLALGASGLNGQSFAFVGYLPTDSAARTLRLRELEAHSRRQQQTQLLIETPYPQRRRAGRLAGGAGAADLAERELWPDAYRRLHPHHERGAVAPVAAGPTRQRAGGVRVPGLNLA